MARYDLKCEHCGHEFETEHAMKNALETLVDDMSEVRCQESSRCSVQLRAAAA